MHGAYDTSIRSFALAALGLAIIGIGGFLHNVNVHNAFHDSRHLFAFPCH